MSSLTFDGGANSVARIPAWSLPANPWKIELVASLTDHTVSTKRYLLRDTGDFELFVENDDLKLAWEASGTSVLATDAFADDDEHTIRLQFSGGQSSGDITAYVDDVLTATITLVQPDASWLFVIGTSWIGTIRALNINDERIYPMREGFGNTLWDRVGNKHGSIDASFTGSWADPVDALTDQAAIDQEFGSVNVDKWADLNNNNDADEIAQRIAYMIGRASDDVRDTLRNSQVTPNITQPRIKSITAKLAGVYLYETRGIQDFNPDTGTSFHRLSYQKRSANIDLIKIKNGALQLGGTLKHSWAPTGYDLGSFSEGTIEGGEASGSS